ncbi:MAG: hypothetical protein IIA64_01485 [Planctomycetes bacterium]|nr:hypothetical protein [Planctomycetota bacterium]
MNVPRLYRQRQNPKVESFAQRLADEFTHIEQPAPFEEINRVLHALTIIIFENRIGRENPSIIDPSALIAAKPSAVRRHRKHDGQRVCHDADHIRSI